MDQISFIFASRKYYKWGWIEALGINVVLNHWQWIISYHRIRCTYFWQPTKNHFHFTFNRIKHSVMCNINVRFKAALCYWSFFQYPKGHQKIKCSPADKIEKHIISKYAIGLWNKNISYTNDLDVWNTNKWYPGT